MAELFDSYNTPSPEFLRSVRSFIGDLVYRHFGNSWVQKFNLLSCCVTLPPLFAQHLFTAPLSSLRPSWFGRQARAWKWSPSSPSALYSQERASLPFYFRPLMSREAGNHGPEAGSDFIVRLCDWERVRLHFSATWLEFSIFPFTKFYLAFRKFPQFHKKFSSTL